MIMQLLQETEMLSWSCTSSLSVNDSPTVRFFWSVVRSHLSYGDWQTGCNIEEHMAIVLLSLMHMVEETRKKANCLP